MAILKELGKSDSLISFVADRPGHDLRYAIDSTKIWKELNWAPEVSFDEGIQMAVQWYLKNRLWWEEILAGEYRDYYEHMCASLEAEGCGCPQP
jgi:dTDP-glucose 4,6-dehydratase